MHCLATACPYRNIISLMINYMHFSPLKSQSQVRGPGFDTQSGNILSFLLPLFQEGQLSVTGESMCTKYWLMLRRSKPAQEKCG